MSKVDEIKKLAEDTWEDNKAYIKEDFLKHGNEDGPSETLDEIALEADGPVYTEDCAKLCMDYFNQESTGFSFDLSGQMGQYDDWVEHTTNLSKVIYSEIFREVLSEKLGNEIDDWKKEYEANKPSTPGM